MVLPYIAQKPLEDQNQQVFFAFFFFFFFFFDRIQWFEKSTRVHNGSREHRSSTSTIFSVHKQNKNKNKANYIKKASTRSRASVRESLRSLAVHLVLPNNLQSRQKTSLVQQEPHKT